MLASRTSLAAKTREGPDRIDPNFVAFAMQSSSAFKNGTRVRTRDCANKAKALALTAGLVSGRVLVSVAAKRLDAESGLEKAEEKRVEKSVEQSVEKAEVKAKE